ncbi:right-handed parallel beta-helix repeat-containing protein [Halobacteriales archaeon Cl-PHB]
MAGGTAIGSVLASSTASAASSDDRAAIVVDGRKVDGTTSYAFSVDGSVEPVDRTGATADAIAGDEVQAEVGDGVHGYRYSGEIVSLETAGPAPLTFGSDATSVLPEQSHEFLIRSDASIDYEFTATGPVEKRLDNGKDSAEGGNDDVVDNGDGTYTVAGFTGNGYGDGYAVQGEVVEFSPMVGDFELVFDGQTVTASELTGDSPTRTLELVSDTSISYEFTVDGPVEKLRDNGTYSAESGNDTVVDNGDGTHTVAGFTGNGYGDGYEIAGEVTSFSPLSGDVEVVLDGQSMTPYELTGTEPPTASGSVIGGGDGFANTVPQRDADYTATTRGELHDALAAAATGDVVYVPGSAAIHADGDTFTVPDGTTLASDRGIDGSNGGLVYESNDQNGLRLFEAGDDVTVTGLRVRGPQHDEASPDGDAWDHGHVGLRFTGSGGEVANCEVYGWGYAGIDDYEGHVAHVHHCHVHHNAQAGLGYGVQVFSNSETVVEYTLFGRNRHCIAGQGNGGYTARYCVVEGDQRSHAFDHHGTGGVVTIVNNRFELAPDRGHASSAYRAREAAADARIHHNWVFHSSGVDQPEQKSIDDAVWYVDGGTYAIHDNHYGETRPPSGIGVQ